MSKYEEEFAKEESLYLLYMRRAEHHKRRMESIKYLMEGSLDELDAAATYLLEKPANKALVAKMDANTADNAIATEDKYPKKKMSDKTITLFTYIGLEGKALQPLIAYSESMGFNWKDHNIRNMMMQYRKNYAFIESPKNGFYKLTQKGFEAINKQLAEDGGIK